MHTYAHCVLTFMVFRKREALAMKVSLFSVFPDLPYIIAYLSSWGTVGPSNREALQEGLATYFGSITHSLTLCVAVAVILLLTERKNYFPFIVAWFLHILVDFLTHVKDAYPIFWPLSDRRFPGFVSYWDPRYHGDTFSMFANWLVTICLCYILISKLRVIYRARHAAANVEAE